MKLSNTVELGYNDHGYNDHGYNEFTPITNKICLIIWSQMVITLVHKPSRLYRCHGYKEQVLTVL